MWIEKIDFPPYHCQELSQLGCGMNDGPKRRQPAALADKGPSSAEASKDRHCAVDALRLFLDLT